MPLTLTLNIEQHSCKCGNQWTNSTVRFANGGTPLPGETTHYPLTSCYSGPLHYHLVCFRCLPSTGITYRKWSAAPPPAGRAANTTQSLAELEEEIFS